MAGKVNAGLLGWCTHSESGVNKAVFSIDVSPDGVRFATGGADQIARIWQLSGVGGQDSVGTGANYLLATLSQHDGAVNCVRFSKNGAYLATGSDDKMVLVWSRTTLERPRGNLESLSSSDTEHWRAFRRLSHSLDVNDLAWHPSRAILASCDMACSVTLWDIEADGRRVGTFSLSTPAKGVAFDCTGSLLAAQDDTGVTIWNVRDRTRAAHIKQPFEGASSSVFFRRLSWSPDGYYLCATNAIRSGACVAALLPREATTGTRPLDVQNLHYFVGHKKAVVSSRWNPRIFKRSSGSETQMCAIGSKDKTLSVWMAGDARPIIVITRMFKESIQDLTWSPDGMRLIICSYNGVVGWIDFSSHHEFQHPLPQEHLAQMIRAQYGDVTAAAQGIPESADHLPSQKRQRLSPSTPTTATAAAPSTTPSTASSTAPSRVPTPTSVPSVPTPTSVPAPGPGSTAPSVQKETRTVKGKRRIAPILVIPAGADGSVSGAVSPAAFAPTPAATPIAAPYFISPASPVPPANNTSTLGPQLSAPPTIPASPTSLPTATSPQQPARSQHLSCSVTLANFRPVTVACLSQKSGVAVATVSEGSVRLWSQRVGLGFVPCALAASPSVVAIGSQNGDLALLSTATGRSLSPLIRLDSYITHMVMEEQTLALLTHSGAVKVILCSTARPHTLSTIAAGHLSEGDRVDKLMLQGHTPVLLLSSGAAFAYSKELGEWIVAGDGGTRPRFPASKYGVAFPYFNDGKGGVLATVDAHARACASRVRSLHLAKQHCQAEGQDSALDAEAKMVRALSLGCLAGYCHWAAQWVVILAAGNSTAKIGEWAQELLARSETGFGSEEMEAFDWLEWLEQNILPLLSNSAQGQRLADRLRAQLVQTRNSVLP